MRVGLRAPLRRAPSHPSLLDTPAGLQSTGLDPLAGHSNGYDSAPLPVMDFVRLHYSLADRYDAHDTASLPTTDLVRFHQSLMSHDNGRRSTLRN